MIFLRRMLPFLGVAMLLAIAYDGWIFYSRWSYAHQADKADALRQAQDARHTLDELGGDRLKILNFYAPVVIRRGGQATICYGVNAAEHVRIDPPVEQLHPALSHCFQVSPAKNTEYKLTAEDGAGHAVTQSLTIRVVP